MNAGALHAGLFTAVALAAPAAAQGAPLWGDLRTGPHDVGFARIWRLDSSRVWDRSVALDSLTGSIARPIRIDLWYPASCDGGEAMPFGSYLEIEPPAAPFEEMVTRLRWWDERSYRNLAGDSSSLARLLTARTSACRDAPPAANRFPLVLYTAGWYNRSPDNTVLAEYLASHGFVVATVPQLNPGLWTYDFRSTMAAMETQIRDLEVALGAVSALPFVDRTRVAAVGHSTGGSAALLFQARTPTVDAVVGLDPSYAYASGKEVVTSPWFGPARNDVPILTLLATDSSAVANRTSIVLLALPLSDRLVAGVPLSAHGSFADDPVQRAFLTGRDESALRPHAAVARATLDFLRATLGDQSTSLHELARRLRGSGMQVTLRPAAHPNQ